MKKIFLIITAVSSLLGASCTAQQAVSNNNMISQYITGADTVYQNEAQLNITGAKNLLFIGDSISYGAGASTMQNAFAYGVAFTYMTWHEPNALYFNASVPGTTTTDGIRQLESCPFVPDVLFIHFGMNDATAFSVELYKANIKANIDRAKEINSDVKIVLISTLCPAVFANVWITIEHIHRLPLYEKALIELKAEYTNVAVCPIFSLTAIMFNFGGSTSSYLTGDGVHPNDTMHNLMALEVLRTIGLY